MKLTTQQLAQLQRNVAGKKQDLTPKTGSGKKGRPKLNAQAIQDLHKSGYQRQQERISHTITGTYQCEDCKFSARSQEFKISSSEKKTGVCREEKNQMQCPCCNGFKVNII